MKHIICYIWQVKRKSFRIQRLQAEWSHLRFVKILTVKSVTSVNEIWNFWIENVDSDTSVSKMKFYLVQKSYNISHVFSSQSKHIYNGISMFYMNDVNMISI